MVDLDALLTCARFCVLSYCDTNTLNKCFKGEPCTLPSDQEVADLLHGSPEPPTTCMDSDADSFAYVVRLKTPGIIYIVFRGTNNLEDIAQDAQLWLEPLLPSDMPHPLLVPQDVRVHSGFHRVYRALAASVVPAIDACMTVTPDATLRFVGFSMGAAVAAIAALACSQKYPGKVSFMSMGMPRVGNHAWASAFDMCVPDALRVVNSSDPVAKLPVGDGYQHVGKELHVGAVDPFPEVPRLACLLDHKLTPYTASVEAYIRTGGVQPAPEATLWSKLTQFFMSLFW